MGGTKCSYLLVGVPGHLEWPIGNLDTPNG